MEIWRSFTMRLFETVVRTEWGGIHEGFTERILRSFLYQFMYYSYNGMQGFWLRKALELARKSSAPFFFTSPLLQGNNWRFFFQGLPMFVYCIVICRFFDLIYIAADRGNGKNEKQRSEFAHMLVHLHLLQTIRPLMNEKRVHMRALCIFICCRQWGYCRRRGFCTHACASYFDGGSTYFFMKINHLLLQFWIW